MLISFRSRIWGFSNLYQSPLPGANWGNPCLSCGLGVFSCGELEIASSAAKVFDLLLPLQYQSPSNTSVCWGALDLVLVPFFFVFSCVLESKMSFTCGQCYLPSTNTNMWT